MKIAQSLAPEGSVARLKIRDGGCYRLMGHILEDPDGRLWKTNRDRLEDPTNGWFDDDGAELIESDDEYLYFGCTKGGPKCGHAFSYQLADWRKQLDDARKTGKVIEIRL